MTEDDSERFSILFRHYFDLTMVQGLSSMEAVSYCLVREYGMTPLEACETIRTLTGREVRNRDVSTYVQRAKKKLYECGFFDIGTGKLE